jgi:hypothetical protein
MRRCRIGPQPRGGPPLRGVGAVPPPPSRHPHPPPTPVAARRPGDDRRLGLVRTGVAGLPPVLGDPPAVRLHALVRSRSWPAAPSPPSTAASRWLPFLAALAGGMLLHSGTNVDQRGLRRPPGHRHDHVPPDEPRRPQGSSQRARRLPVRRRSLFAAAQSASASPCLLRGPAIVALGLLGIVAGYTYTAPPFQYKYKAMGVPIVFLIMGPIMTVGSYFAVTGAWDLRALVLSLPVGLLVAAISTATTGATSATTRAPASSRCRLGSAATGPTMATSPSFSARTSRSVWRSPLRLAAADHGDCRLLAAVPGPGRALGRARRDRPGPSHRHDRPPDGPTPLRLRVAAGGRAAAGPGRAVMAGQLPARSRTLEAATALGLAAALPAFAATFRGTARSILEPHDGDRHRPRRPGARRQSTTSADTHRRSGSGPWPGLGGRALRHLQLGDRFARRFVPGGDDQIRDIYSLRDLAPARETAARLVTIIGPAEELFWRGLVQEALMRRYGRWTGAAWPPRPTQPCT